MQTKKVANNPFSVVLNFQMYCKLCCCLHYHCTDVAGIYLNYVTFYTQVYSFYNYNQFQVLKKRFFFLQGQHDLTNKSSLEEMLEKVKEQGKLYLEEPFHQKDFLHYFNSQTWEE